MTTYDWTAILGAAEVPESCTHHLLDLADKAPMIRHMFDAITHGYPVGHSLAQTLDFVAAENVKITAMVERLLAMQPPAPIHIDTAAFDGRVGLRKAATYLREYHKKTWDQENLHSAPLLKLADEIEAMP